MLLNLVNYLRVVKSAAVVFEVDYLRGLAEEIQLSPRVIVAFFEGLQGGCCLAFEAEGGGNFGPVEFEGGGALGWVLVASRAQLE